MTTAWSLSVIDESLLIRIAQHLVEDRSVLYALSLVNRLCSIAARHVLYQRISVSSRSDLETLRDFMDNQVVLPDDRLRNMLTSSLLPRNVEYVRSFGVTGFIFPGLYFRPIDDVLKVILPKYTRLRSFVWRPMFSDTEAAMAVVNLLPQLPSLEMLSIKVPFSMPPIPESVSARPVQSLEAITEEDEGLEGDEQSPRDLESLDGIENESDADGEDAEPYEYKPLEDDPDESAKPKPTLLCPVPPKELTQLQSLILASPTPEVLVPLPDVLRALEHPLRTLCLEDDCGSVTPGILTSLLPVSQELEHFGLGVAYSLKYDDLFLFLDELSNLRRLDLYHYTQNFIPGTTPPRLRVLESFKMRHAHTASRKEVLNMCVWIRRITSSSPLVVLDVACENPRNCRKGYRKGLLGHAISHDGLIDHLISRHRETLRILRLSSAYIGKRAFRKMFGKEGEGFEILEEVDICVRKQTFEMFTNPMNSTSRLREIRFTIVNLKESSMPKVDKDLLERARGKPSLRTVLVNGRGYKGEWIAQCEDDGSRRTPPKLNMIFHISELKSEEYGEFG